MKTLVITFVGGVTLLHFSLTAPAQTVATTLAATSVGPTNATLHGTVNPNGAAAVGYFQYGPTTNYGYIGGFMALPATNTAQTLPGLVVNALTGAAGANWTNAGLPATNWYAIASSADGTGLAAAAGGLIGAASPGGIYISTNSGATWTQSSAPGSQWTCIACSADGSRLAAGVEAGGIYYSTNRGSTWALSSAPSVNWASIASSADGTRMAAVINHGGIFTSTDGGATWTQTSAPGTNFWYGIASSADGTRFAAVAYGGGIYTSTNSGSTWTLTSAPVGSWSSVASSADGAQLAAVVNGGGIDTSTNSGATWTPTSAPYERWLSVVSSADGTRLVAGVDEGGIYISTDSGLTWAATSAPGGSWQSIAASADASKLAAVASARGGTGIFISTGLASPVTPATTYHYRAAGLNSAGTSMGNDLTFTTPLAAPIVATLAATGITSTNATLNATVNPSGAASVAYFRYGLTTSYGSYTATNALLATNTALSVSALISNLSPGTTYHFQVLATNTLGTSLGNDLALITSAAAPTAATLSAGGITSTNATLSGTVNPKGAATSAYFQFGPTTNYGSFSATNTLAATNTTLSVSNSISNLLPGTAYHFSLVAGNSVGASLGNDLTFTTSAGAPTATTLPATGITSSNATLNGSLFTGELNSSVYFRYGLTTNYGSFSATNTLAATNMTLSVSNPISNLTLVTTYHFQLVVTNSVGTNFGNDLTFTTSPAVPSVTTLAPTSITPSNATFNGTVNPNGAATTAYFQYGLTTNYDNLGGFMALPAIKATQTLPGLIVNSLNSPAGATWTQTSAATSNWFSIASSADGSRLAALIGGQSGVSGGIYTSTNAGATWTQTGAPILTWYSIASSADGSRLAAGASPYIYTSTNAGVSWTQAGVPTATWQSIASAADGINLAATVYGGGIYTSTNGGVSWTQTSAPGANFWKSIASSADGSRLTAADLGNGGGGRIYFSTDGGATWTTANTPVQPWTSLASSADGMRLAAVNQLGYVWGSSDGGVTWNVFNNSPFVYWNSVGSSADGSRMTAGMHNGGLYTSVNSGGTWPQGSAPNAAWSSIASSADGSRLAAAANGAIYVSAGTLSQLMPGAYHYRVVALNIEGTSFGNDVTFIIPGAPTAATLSASSVTSTNATLNGTVNPDGAATSAYFRYGLTTNYGSFSATNALGATNVTFSVSNLVGGLTPGTTYHFQSVAANSVGINVGNDLTFVTLAMPAVTTLPATSITSTNATLNGTVNPNGAATSVYFRYGVSSGYGSYTATNSLPATNATLSLSNLVGSLGPATTYHFQLVAGNSAGTNAGADQTFTTGIAAPAVISLSAGGVTATNATLNGAVNPNGAATAAYFRYGSTTNYGSFSATNTLAATNFTLSVSNLVGSLTPGTTYHFQLVAGNSVGTNAGVDYFFTTGAAAPTVTTIAATGISSSSATLNGTVNPNGAATSAYFRYGLTTSYGSYSVTNTFAATNFTLSVSKLVGSLTSGTTYHFQLVAGNSFGTNAGADLTFTTGAAAPSATTLAATSVSSTSATLNGSVNPNGAATTAYFRYGLTTNYGSYGDTFTLSAVSMLSSLITNLTPGTTNHFQLVASNSVGTSLGSDLIFVTPAPPAVTTLAGTSITPSNATLNGTVNPNGAATTAYFQYGLTTNYDNDSGFIELPASNTVLSLPGLVVSALHRPAGAIWTQTSAPGTNLWSAIASSADGTRLAAVEVGGGIYTSTNSGATWALTSAPIKSWNSIASSADGSLLAAAVGGGSIYTSTNGGSTWTQTSQSSTGSDSIACSADGSQLVAAYNSGIYISTNAGSSWAPSFLLPKKWFSIACSADGSRLAAVISGGGIYTSSDGGNVWISNSVAASAWNNIASSADGSRLAATVSGGGIYTSTNGGNTWTITPAPITAWVSLASSADGTRLAAAVQGGGIYTSTNGGITWIPTGVSSTNWNGLAFSADGTKLAAVVYGAGIYTSAGLPINFTSGTTYHFRAAAVSFAGASFGNDLTFTIPGVPAATTLSASGITSSNATLFGSINPNGADTTAYFRYGQTTNYGSYSATNTLAATNGTAFVTNSISSLTPGTTYHFQLVASNSVATSLGNDLIFKSSAAAPTATTLAATGVGSSSATLNGSVNPNGAITTTYFQYGLTTNYGSYSATNNLAATNSTLSVSNSISSLTPGTTYHFQLVAGNSVSTNVGADLTFITAPAVPTATTLAASGITASNATLNGTVNQNGATTTAYFQYGLTTNYGSYSATNVLAGANVSVSVSNSISSLAPGTTYHFQLVAANAAGTSAGADMQFTTQSQAAQAVSFNLNGPVSLPGGAFQFSFTNLSGVSFTVLATTDLSLPLANWTVLGAPVEGPPGKYQFTDPQATNIPVRFYRVTSP